MTFRQKARQVFVNSNTRWWLAAIIALVIVGWLLFEPLKVQYVAHAQASLNPFTIQKDLYAFDEQTPDGWLALKETTARRSDGATARISKALSRDGSFQGQMRVVDLPNGQEFIVYDDVQEFVRPARPPGWVVTMRKNALLHPPSNCITPGQTLTGYGTIQGVKVAIIKPLPTDSPKVTLWEAPSLGCQVLESKDEAAQADGTYALQGQTKLVSIATGEPDANLFTVPADYHSVMPSVALHDEWNHIGRPWSDKIAKIASGQDSVYLQHLSGHWPAPPTGEINQNPGAESPRP